MRSQPRLLALAFALLLAACTGTELASRARPTAWPPPHRP